MAKMYDKSTTIFKLQMPLTLAKTVIVIPQLRCFQLYSPWASYIGCASYICFASDIALRAALEANIISLPQSGNITFVQRKYHSGAAGI